jgi:adenosylcobinamide-GDP ribazoletransferase
MSTQWRHRVTAPRFTPLLGMFIGAVGGGVYWLAAQIWPASIAVILSMLATTLLSAGASTEARLTDTVSVGFVFAVIVKYNTLMALSAANLPFALPANCALGLIMIAGQACSRAVLISVPAAPVRPVVKPASVGDIGIAWAIGFAPAALLGLPGLVGLAGAILARILIVAYLRRRRPAFAAADLDGIQQLTEVCFYLSALAAWAYI